MILLSTAYCPPLLYMAQFMRGEKVRIEEHESYQKQSWRNRCSIYTANGLLNLVVPVSKPYGNRTKTKDIVIFNEYKWNLEHWRAITSAYNNSPFFLYYKDELQPLFKDPARLLIEHNNKLLRKIFELTGIDADFGYTGNFVKDPQNAIDLRNQLSPKKKLNVEVPVYEQVFADKMGYQPNLSILDVLFNKGPETSAFLRKVVENNYLS